jgi:hypothetical protein
MVGDEVISGCDVSPVLKLAEMRSMRFLRLLARTASLFRELPF